MKNNLEKTAKEIRKNILSMHFLSQESHVGSALSCADILAVLYFKIMNIDPKKPQAENRDRFILSKGHAVSALYATLAQKGFFPKKLLDSFCQDNTKLPGHPTRNSVPGIEASTGSLGHGLPMATGMALAAKKDKKTHKIFVLMSDGELDEGSNWESALFAGHHQLDNLVAIIDRNDLQAFGKTKDVLDTEPLAEKWQSFGWAVKKAKGHNLDNLEKTLLSAPFKKNKPNLIITDTIKGAGVSFMENSISWHYKSPDKDELNQALKELMQ